MDYKVYDELTLSELLIGLFKDYKNEKEEHEKLSSFISITYKFIQKEGMKAFDPLSLEFLLKPGILFKRPSTLKTEEDLAIAVKELFIDDLKEHASLILLILLSLSEEGDDKSNPCKPNNKLKSILYKLDDNIVEYLITNLRWL